jgi:hypothetical protein
LWDDLWHGQILKLLYPQLHSFAINDEITLKGALSHASIQELFHLPLSKEAYEQFCDLDILIQSLHHGEQDTRSYIWENASYSSAKVYKHMLGAEELHLAFTWLWNSACQQKHKVFFCLLLQDKLNTNGLHRKKNMHLESYTCDTIENRDSFIDQNW